ncbi:helix-turn-helix domain-containing protein [Thermophagus sp. OGC60D27]|uniref:helix-turn-helix domain-containing protein n=1 Tax=Thermophagus sp. OGC60D27 TaxID=3458415 RepID=UPI0040381AAE
MGIVFLVVPVQNNTNLKPYKKSLIILSVAYFSFASLFILSVLLMPKLKVLTEFFDFIGLVVGYIQALLFTFSLLLLIDSRFVTVKRIVHHTIPLILFVLVYFTFCLFFDVPVVKDFSVVKFNLSNPCVFTRVLFSGLYLVQISYYVYLFLLIEKKCKKDINNYYSGNQEAIIRTVHYLFFAATTMGVLAFLWIVYPVFWIENVLIVFSSVFYLVFAINYIRYPIIFFELEPLLKDTSLKKEKHFSVEMGLPMDWAVYKAQIEKSKIFLKKGITLEELALWLGVSRTVLSNSINSQEGKNFNSWINSMRISEAIQMMNTQPELPIAQIAELTGYSEPSNFGRQFKLITGSTPGQYKKAIQLNI